MMDLQRYIRDIPDFPKPGIVFKDITPLLADSVAFRATVAYGLGTGLALVRKPGKLPHQTYAARYELEYGSDTLEIHHDAIGDRHRVLVIDDLLATGGTASAAVELVRRCGGEVIGCAFVIELAFLKGRARLDGHEVFSLVD